MYEIFNKKATKFGTDLGNSIAKGLDSGVSPETMARIYRGQMSTAYNTINSTCPNKMQAKNLFDDVKLSSQFAISSRGYNVKTFIASA